MKIYLAGQNGAHNIQQTIIGGGFDQIDEDVSLHKERNLLQLGGEGSDEIISGKSTYDTEVQRRNELHVQHVRGWL